MNSCTSSSDTPAGIGQPAGQRQAGIYLKTLAAAIVSTAIVLLVVFVSQRAWIGGCDGRGYAEDAFIANCASHSFEDYEHGAIYLGLEERTISNLRAAEILFLGSSHTQAAFSNDTVREFFRVRKSRHYLLGFSDAEQDKFPKFIIEKFDLRPRYLVVNTGFFFEDTLSQTGRRVVNLSTAIEVEYAIKWLMGRIHQWVCGAEDNVLQGIMCGRSPTVYRTNLDGHWIYFNQPKKRHVPLVSTSEFLPAVKARLPGLIANARRFQAAMRARGACMIITGTPTENGQVAGVARAVARAIGAPSIVPDLKNLTGYDSHHLNMESSRIFSRAFLAGLNAATTACGRRP